MKASWDAEKSRLTKDLKIMNDLATTQAIKDTKKKQWVIYINCVKQKDVVMSSCTSAEHFCKMLSGLAGWPEYSFLFLPSSDIFYSITRFSIQSKMAQIRCTNFYTTIIHFEGGVVGWCNGVMYLASPGHPTDIDLQLGKACYPWSR